MSGKTSTISAKVVARLSLYRRLLASEAAGGARHIYSHQLAIRAGVSAEQVRRDMMAVGYSGTPIRGYCIAELTNCIDALLDAAQGQSAAIVGLGNLGQAITVYSAGRWPKLSIVAAFDQDPAKVGEVINGCTCYLDTDIPRVVAERDIRVAIITVPASEAQKVADRLVEAGVKGILNFAPARLRVPPDVYVENMDVAVSLEKVAYFARQGAVHKATGGARETGTDDAVQ
jgi:redox-sensing transcriptional repressor